MTYITIADSKYFLGAVALVNSLRLTGNLEPILVIDAGLTEEQSGLLAQACEVRPAPVDPKGTHAAFLKAAVHLLGLEGTIVLVDSDVIVTSRLQPILAEASAGKICAFADEPILDRRLAVWTEVLGLERELDDRPHINTGFVALRADIWAGLLRRWWELSDRVRFQRSMTPWEIQNSEDPFAYGDQDVLNAILMSEIPEESVQYLDWNLIPPVLDTTTRIVDRTHLVCEYQSRPTTLLHYWAFPKPWVQGARTQLVLHAQVELMARLLTASDVPIQLEPRDVPIWLRDGVVGRLVRRGPRKTRRALGNALRLLPEPVERRASDLLWRAGEKIRLG